jgi:hypothetical protein
MPLTPFVNNTGMKQRPRSTTVTNVELTRVDMLFIFIHVMTRNNQTVVTQGVMKYSKTLNKFILFEAIANARERVTVSHPACSMSKKTLSLRNAVSIHCNAFHVSV